MKSLALKIMIPMLLSPVFWAGTTVAQNVDYAFHWAPSPIIDGNGIVRPEAVAYEVYVKFGTAAEELVATVNDTIYTMSAQPGVVQRLMVRAVDVDGRYSAMSVASEPIYFEAGAEENRGVPGLPPVAELGPNYPNPFNPETQVVYGVPESVSAGDLVRLDIYSVQGQLVRRLEVDRTPGWHEVTWDGKNDAGLVASTGLYLTRFTVGAMVTSGKMTMVK